MASAAREAAHACAGLSRAILHEYRADAALAGVLAAVRAAGAPRAPPAGGAEEEDDGWCALYPSAARQPYVALAAQGPWIGTTAGGVVYDVGGYGMLGWGHNPRFLKGALSADHVQANIMTPSVHQREFMRALRGHIAHTAERGAAPYTSFVALNSGSEGVSFALRMARVGRHGDGPEAWVRMSNSFHGRTDMPALMSASSDAAYRRGIGGWADAAPRVETVAYNDVAAVDRAFARLRDEGFAVRAAIAEPVQGEGAPGLPMTREFYAALREASSAHGAALIVDSVQAGIRAQGCLSVVDYPAFAGLAPPDMEVFSKAIHGGQYVVSGAPRRIDRAGGGSPPLRDADTLTRAHTQVPAVDLRHGARGARVPGRHLRQHDDRQPPRARRGHRGAQAAHAGLPGARAPAGAPGPTPDRSAPRARSRVRAKH